MSHRPEVVVVDGLRETTEVLRAILEPRGVSVSHCTSPVAPRDQTSDAHRVLVLHENATTAAGGPRVIVGRLSTRGKPNDSHCLPQPFHYGDLIAAIDALAQHPAP